MKRTILKRILNEAAQGNFDTVRKIANLVVAEIPFEYRSYQTFARHFFVTHQPIGTKKILYLVPGFNYGGAEITDCYLIDGLARQGFTVYLVGTDLTVPSKIWYDQFSRSAQVALWLPDFARNPGLQTDFLLRMVVHFGIDLVFNRNSGAGYRSLPKFKQLPYLKLVDLLHTHNFGNDWILYSRQNASLLDRRYVTSDDLKTYAAKHGSVPGHKIQTIYCGTDADTYPPLSERSNRRAAFLESLELPTEAKIVTYYGRFSDQKDPLRWVAVAAKLLAKAPAIRFVLAGDGELLEETKTAIQQQNLEPYVRFTGRLDTVFDIASATDVLLLTSKFEGLPTVFFEFLMMGTPIVTTNVGGVNECISSEVFGFVVPLQASDKEIADQVLRFLTPEQHTSERQYQRRQHILDTFTVNRMQAIYAEELTALIRPVDLLAKRQQLHQLWQQQFRKSLPEPAH
ncbi:glycosyltransferase [Tellurirhabdus bombi]|uniref:glycosyltransferase n=1 Tax=Tellurirhabdus bombi TaxID=2907205 RepID=UPI001F41978A|nr:glycosyltransferase [Tellurirhabdus bombi]